MQTRHRIIHKGKTIDVVTLSNYNTYSGKPDYVYLGVVQYIQY